MDPSGKSKGPPPAVKKVLSMFGSGREEDRMTGYLSFLKIGPKLLRFLPGALYEPLHCAVIWWQTRWPGSWALLACLPSSHGLESLSPVLLQLCLNMLQEGNLEGTRPGLFRAYQGSSRHAAAELPCYSCISSQVMLT